MLPTQTPSSAAPARISGATTELKFRIQGGMHDGRILRIAAAKCTIGSAEGCTLRLRGDEIEPLHCLILTGRNGTIVRRNSPRTYLNGGTFEDAPLHPGDLLRIGPVELAVVACPQPPSYPQPLGGTPSESPRLSTPPQESADTVQLKLEQQRLTVELGSLREELRAAREQVAVAEKGKTDTSTDKTRLEHQLQEQYTVSLETLHSQQRAERAESQAREEKLQSELSAAQRSMREMESRVTEREAGFRAEQRQRELERTESCAQKQDLEAKLAQLEAQQRQRDQQGRDETASVRGQLESTISTLTEQLRQRQAELSAAQESIQDLEKQFAQREAGLRAQQEQREREQAETCGERTQLEQKLEELESDFRQREQQANEEFASVRDRLEASIQTLTQQLQQRESELTAEQQRGGELAAVTSALESVRGELRDFQQQRSLEQEEQTALRQKMESQGAETAARLLERDQQLAQRDAELAELRERTERLSASEQTIKQLEENLASFSLSQQTEREGWGNDRSELENRLSSSAAEYQGLLARNQELESQFGSVQAEASELRVKCQSLEFQRSEKEAAALDAQNAAAARCETMIRTISQLQAELDQARATGNVAQFPQGVAATQFWQPHRNEEDSQAKPASLEQFASLETKIGELEAQCTNLQTQRSALESQITELQTQSAQAEQLSGRCGELEGQLAELKAKLDQPREVVVAHSEAAAQPAADNVTVNEQQVEQWRTEAKSWQLKAEEAVAQLGEAKQLCARLSADVSAFQAASRAQGEDDQERQDIEALRNELAAQKQELAAAHARLQEEEAQAEKMDTDSSAREVQLARLEAQLNEQKAVWESDLASQTGALEERSQLLASQIKQFEAEQAAFSRQQANLIQQMSALEDRVQELTNANEGRMAPASFLPPVAEPSAASESEQAAQPEATPPNAESPEPVPVPASEEPEQKALYTPPSFLDQAAEMVRQEEQGLAPTTPEPPQSPPYQPAARDVAKEEDDSIEQYMSRLLSRVRGSDGPVSSSPVVRESQPAAVPQQPAASAAAPVVETPREPKEFVPRAQAPEGPQRLSLMRELANSAAQSAIHTHARQSQKRETKTRSLVALLSLTGAAALLVTAMFTHSPLALAGAIIFIAVCGVMVIRAIAGGIRQMRLAVPKEIGDSKQTSEPAKSEPK